MPKQVANQYSPANPASTDQQLWGRVNFLLSELQAIKSAMQGLQKPSAEIKGLQVQIQAAADSLTELQTFVGKGNAQFVSTSSSLSATGVGMTITGSIGSGTIAISNAATFRSAISAAQKTSVGAHTITLAKLTPAGTNGSISWNADGCVSAYVDPT